MKVSVDPDKCQGHTLCAMRAPTVFQLSEIDGHASTSDDDVAPELWEDVREAARSCPEQAVDITE
jgi:ferredoxin